MKSPKTAIVPMRKQPQHRKQWASTNAMHFLQSLRDAIPGPDLPGCDRLLALSSIDASWTNAIIYGPRVQLTFRVEETGRLTGAFDVKAYLNVDAARALAATLQKLIERQPNSGGVPPAPA